MSFLIDSHTFLWSMFEPACLSNTARDVMLDPEQDIFVSKVTFWELSLKYGLGKLQLEGVTPEAFPKAAEDAGFTILPVDAATAASFYQLPQKPHKDPFDRLLAWQAIREDHTLISCDPDFDNYRAHGLQLLW